MIVKPFYTSLILSLTVAVAVLTAPFRSHELLASEPPVKLWTGRIETSEIDNATDLALDDVGNVFVCGHTKGSMTGFTNKGGIDGFLVKYDPRNQVEWTLQWGRKSDELAYAVAPDGVGGVYVTGCVHENSIAEPRGFLSRIDASGKTTWCNDFDVTNVTCCRDVCVDHEGFVYVVGDSRRDNGGNMSGFVRKHLADGTPI